MAFIAALAAFQVGCGGDDGEEQATKDTSPPATTEPTQAGGGAGKKLSGKKLFVDGCGQCHVLAAAGTTGTIGPDLDHEPFSEEKVLGVVAKGRGQMPAEIYMGEEAEQVAKYVSQNSAGGEDSEHGDSAHEHDDHDHDE